MTILVIGSGGREHALVWKIAQSKKVSKIYCATGNGGTAGLAENIPIKIDEISKLGDFAERNSVDLTIVGSELPLTLGIADEFEKRGLKVFGPSAKAAEIEGSKVFAKNLMKKYGIPTAGYEVFSDPTSAKTYITQKNRPCVVKTDGLAAGKGAIVCQTVSEALAAVDAAMSEFGAAGARIVIEEMMAGEEASIFAITDGNNYAVLPSAQDHKRIFDGDKGKNTGGMGAYAPAPVVTPGLLGRIKNEIIEPTLAAMSSEGRTYRGVLYCGIMITETGPKVVEFNCRFGDPECQVLMPLIENDIVDLFFAACENRIAQFELRVKNASSVCVVIASGGYPDIYEKGKPVTVSATKNAVVFHAGTEYKNGELVTSGGRVFGVTATGSNLPDALKSAYMSVQGIHFEKMYYRRDIGHRAL